MTRRMSLLVFAVAAAVAVDAAADACDQSVLLQTQSQKTEANAMPDCGGGPFTWIEGVCKCDGDVKAQTAKGLNGCPDGMTLKLSIYGSKCVEDKPKEPKPARCESLGKFSHLTKEYDCGAYTSENECYTNRLKGCTWKPAEP